MAAGGMTGPEAVDWIHGRHGLGNKEGLTNTAMLMERMGHPERAYPCVHVAGTNGKGSVCAMIASALRAAGYKVGLYTSPYLERYNDRMRVDGRPIADDVLGEVASDARRHVAEMDAIGRRATVFEIGTACALEFFRRERVDVAVIEVGLGGRLDSTNVITPVLSVITHIGLDHMAILGGTVERIAMEKAGIIKRGVPCVLYPQGEPVHSIIRDVCAERGAAFLDAAQVAATVVESDPRGHTLSLEKGGWSLRDVRVSMAGDHQIDNLRTAVAAVLVLRGLGFAIGDGALAGGLAAARWPGRLEWFGNILLDGAHNEQGARALAAYIGKYLPGRQIHAVCGIVRGKAEDAIVRAVAPCLRSVRCVTVTGHRAGDPGELARLFEREGVAASAAASVSDAIEAAAREAGEDGVALVFGSLYLVAEARALLLGKNQ